jgi:ABC-type transport system involved in multi-copper enzyme maturation permease subunit
MNTTFTISKLTFREAARRKILWAALLLGILDLIVYGLGFYFIEQDIQRSMGRGGMSLMAMNQIYNFLLMTGLYAVNFLTIAMAVLTSVDTIAGEISSGTMQTLVTKPVRRWEVLMGKWVGFAVMMTLYLIMMAGGTMAIVYGITGYTADNALQGFLLLWMNALLLLSVSFFGGSFLSTLANGVLAFGLFGVAFIGSWIEQLGSVLNNPTAVRIGVISSLIIPSEALWKRASHLMQSPLVSAMGFSPFTAGSVPSPAMVWYALIYILVMLGLAIYIFTKRDL